jgi:hypothetical protein
MERPRFALAKTIQILKAWRADEKAEATREGDTSREIVPPYRRRVEQAESTESSNLCKLRTCRVILSQSNNQCLDDEPYLNATTSRRSDSSR